MQVAFIQIIELTTADADAIRQLDDEWVKASEGKRTARRQILARDRNHPDRFVEIVFFDSHETAMENSNLAETQVIAATFQSLAKELVFHDLDVIGDQAL
jgi:hypothetical protein